MDKNQDRAAIDAEYARLYAERTEKLKGKTAFDFCRDHEAACIYLERRVENGNLGKGTALAQFMQTLSWKYRTEYTIQADLPNEGAIVHELSPGKLHSFPIWGEMYYRGGEDNDWQEPELFDSLECFAAFMMARFW